MNRPDGPVEIRLENALKYPIDPDRAYRVADTTHHLKLRVLTSGERYWEYDYIWNGKRHRTKLGDLGKGKTDNTLTPAQARAIVGQKEATRKGIDNQGIGRDPYSKSSKGVSLNNQHEDYFEGSIKPYSNKEGIQTEGVCTQEYNERKRRFKKHIEPTVVGSTRLLSLDKSEIQKWFNSIARHSGNTEAKSCLFLAKHMTEHILDNNEELENAIGNRFKKVKLTKVNADIKSSRKTRKISDEEMLAIWTACNQWPNKLDACFVKFIVTTASRGKPVMELEKADIEYDAKRKVYHFTVLHKKKLDTVVLTDRGAEVYQEILEAHKELKIDSPYLFPSLDYTGLKTGGHYNKVRNRPMNTQDKKRLWTGTKYTSGIRAIAAMDVPSIAGVAPTTKKQRAERGRWIKTPIGLHDVRDFYGSNASSREEAADMLQNIIKEPSATDIHYREKDFEYKMEVANKKAALLNIVLDY